MSEFSYAVFVDEPPQESFDKWPQHVTIFEWFEAGKKDIEEVGEVVASKVRPFEIQVGANDPNYSRSRNARLIKPSVELNVLHHSLYAHLEVANVAVWALRGVESRFDPHLTGRRAHKREIPKKIEVTHFELVKRSTDGSKRATRSYKLRAK